MNTEEKLNRLSELQAQAEVIRLKYEDLAREAYQTVTKREIDKIPGLTPEVKEKIYALFTLELSEKIKAELDAVNAERDTALESLNDGIAKLTDEIKTDVLPVGKTVKGAHLMAVWSKGRTSWITDNLTTFISNAIACISRMKPTVQALLGMEDTPMGVKLMIVDIVTELSGIESALNSITESKKTGEPSVTIRTNGK